MSLSILYLLLPMSLAFVLLVGISLWWAVFNGQYDNAESDGRSILQDNDTDF